MCEQFLYEKFSQIDLSDSFFDSLKCDYSEFETWFKKKQSTGDNAFIQVVDNSLEGFLYLKKETGPITDISPSLDCNIALKIGTFKVNPHGTRLGERFIKKSIDYAINENIDLIYVTIFSHHEYLLKMFQQFGFYIHGSKITPNGTENVLVKSISSLKGNIFLDYPKVNPDSKSYLLGIRPEFHTKLFPDSKLFNEKFDVIRDVSHTNSITKIYIAKMYSMAPLKPNDNLIIYRTKDDKGSARYRSVATTICTVIDNRRMTSFSTYEDLKEYCKNYSIFSDEDLKSFFSDSKKYFVVKMLYNVSLNKRIIQGRLIDEIGLNPSYWGFAHLTTNQFKSIVDLGEINKSYLL